MNTNKYFDAPVFASPKSTYLLHWRSEFEKRLMTFFDQDSRIADYLQPQMAAIVKIDEREFEVEIDFWLEYASGKVILIHVARKDDFPQELEKQILAGAKNWLEQDGFDFITVEDNALKHFHVRTVQPDLFVI